MHFTLTGPQGETLPVRALPVWMTRTNHGITVPLLRLRRRHHTRCTYRRVFKGKRCQSVSCHSGWQGRTTESLYRFYDYAGGITLDALHIESRPLRALTQLTPRTNHENNVDVHTGSAEGIIPVYTIIASYRTLMTGLHLLDTKVEYA